MADDKNKGSSTDTLELDEAAPETLQLDEELPGAEAKEEKPQHDVDVLPGATPRLRATAKTFTPPKQIEKEAPPENFGFQEDYGIPLLSGARLAGRALKGLGNVYDFGKGLAGDVYDAATSDDKLGAGKELLNKYFVKPQMEQADQAKPFEEAARNAPLGSREGILNAMEGTGHRIASMTPLVGPWVAQHAEHGGQTGDIPGELAETGGEMAGGELLHKVGTHPIETARTLGKVGDYVARGTPLTEEGKLAAAKKQALTVKKPTMTETEYESKVDAALPELQRIAQDNKGQIKNPQQAVQAISNRISQIEQPIRDHLNTVPDAQQMVTAQDITQRVSQAMDDALSNNAGHYTPEEIQKAKDGVLKFIGDQDKPLRELEGNRRRLNADADSYFNSSPADKRKINASDAEAVAQRAAANAVRDYEYGDAQNPGALERIGLQATDAQGRPINFRDVRKTTGNLIDVRDHFEDAITRAQSAGEWKPFDAVKKGPSLAAGGLGAITGGAIGGWPGALLGTLMGEGAKAWADYRASKNPNLNTQKMFRNLEQTTPRPTVDVTATVPPVPAPAVPFRAPAAVPQAPPPVPAAHAVQPIGNVGGGALGMRGLGGVRIAGQLPESIPAEPTAPPAVAPEFQREPIGNVANPRLLGAGGLGGVNRSVRGLLPAPETVKPMVPPVVEPRFAREETRPLPEGEELSPDRRLGMMGRGGVRNPIRGLLPEMSAEGQRGWLLIRSVLDTLESADKPGRYFDAFGQNEAHNLRENPKEGTRHGGQWRGVKSLRTKLPWLQDNDDFTPEDLRHALKQAEKGKITPVMRSAIEFEKRRAAKAPAEREPGEDEEPHSGEGGEAPF